MLIFKDKKLIQWSIVSADVDDDFKTIQLTVFSTGGISKPLGDVYTTQWTL